MNGTFDEVDPRIGDVGLARRADASVVTVTGEIDLFVAPNFARAVRQGLDADMPVVVDLSDCSFFESSGLNALLSAAPGTEAAGRKIHVVRPPESCAERVLSLTVPGHFSEHDSRDAALAAVAA